MVETLIGVEHGRGLYAEGVRLAQEEYSPSNELLDKLSTLPKGARIGIEHTPELDSEFSLDGISIKTPSKYWVELREACESKGLEVVYLEDFPTYVKFLRKMLEAQSYDSQVMDRMSELIELRPGMTMDEGEKDEQLRVALGKSYRAGVEKDYIFLVERETKILDKIAKEDPLVAVLGNGHANYELVSPLEFLSRGILVGVNLREVRPATPWHWPEGTQLPAYLDKNNKPDRNLALKRELITRKYRALTQGRITTDEIPDFIGTWDLGIPASGIFELFLDDDGVHGKMEDTLGSASIIVLEHSQTGIIFDKIYHPGASDITADEGRIIFTGELNDGSFRGKFQLLNGQKREFLMIPYFPPLNL